MGKIIDLSAVMEKEEKLEQIADYMGELKDEFAALIQDQRKLDTLTEALDALEDAYDMVNEVL